MTEAEPESQRPTSTALAAPEHPELPVEVRQAFVELDRKCGVFIFPQLQLLGADGAVSELTERAQRLAAAAAAGELAELAGRYRELLAEAQAALRGARTAEVRRDDQARDRRRGQAQLEASLTAAKGRLPVARMTRLQQRLEELGEEAERDQKVALVEAAVAEWDRLSQVRQSREADRLAERAHDPVRRRQQLTSRSRKALRDRALVVELARSFSLGAEQPVPDPEPDPPDQ